MEDATNASEPRARKKPFILFTLVQWIVAIAFAILVLGMLVQARKLSLPDAPVAMFWLAFGAIAIVAALHLPPIYFRLPRKGKTAAYVAILPAFILFVVSVGQLDAVYSKTPEGAKRMAERQAEDAKDAADAREREATAKTIADMEKTKADLEQLRDKLEACFSWGHHLPDLEKPVKESLHNPDSFQHVKTELIVPDDQRNNVEMTFRAENGFGAIRTSTVRAQLVADPCMVQEIGSFDVN